MDYFLFQQINGLAGQWEWLNNLAIFFAKYFEYFLIISIFVIFLKKWKIISQVFLAAIISRLGIVELIRWLWERPRPFVENNVNLLLERSASNSFPSGHASFYFAIAAVVYLYNKKIGKWFFAVSFLISIARVFSGIHWPSDILAGAFVGILCGWFIVKILKKKPLTK